MPAPKQPEFEEEPQGESGGNVVGTGNQDRLDKLSMIADQHERNVEDQFANVNDDDTTEPFTAPKSEDTEDDTEDKPVVVPKAEEPPAPEPKAEEAVKHKIKVNGKELELSTEELIERAQKVESADEYLRKAKETVKPAPKVGPSAEEVKRQQDSEDLALARALQMGTEEEAIAAVRKIRVQASARPSIQLDDVNRTIDERLTYKDAITAFSREYEDIWKDPMLKQLALAKDTEMLENGDDRSYADRYTEIGNELRTWVKSKVPEAKTEESKSQEETLKAKEEKKAALPRAPVPASKKTEAPAEDNTESETASDIIRGIAKSRGGPQWMR